MPCVPSVPRSWPDSSATPWRRLRGCYASGTGTLYLEDIAPARQGDVLVDPGDDALRAAIRTIADRYGGRVRTVRRFAGPGIAFLVALGFTVSDW
jgi:hypothetical protein